MPVYLQQFTLPDNAMELKWLFELDPERKASMPEVYPSRYPFYLFDYVSETVLDFDRITFLYGSNGSGKSTLLNLIAEKLGLEHRCRFNKTDFFDDYLRLCSLRIDSVPDGSRILTGEDVFQKLSDTRGINEILNEKRKAIRNTKYTLKQEARDNPQIMKLQGLDDYDRWMEYYDAVEQSSSDYIRARAQVNLTSRSNGETALKFLTDEIKENALYLLDEPETSLSPAFQAELKKFIEDSARFFGCQFIIATHSPLLISAKEAKIYNLDDDFSVCKWYELENVKTYAAFFKAHAELFD